ncbi:unnamed protein product [Coffea canephora]|uniref:Uncharacterized protein n=1 Tax=Coffea canephora TaxID=49390 RepID=A0A068UWE1_COFCA|nr:unnamed protein product [Coffea canephora]
MYHAVRLMHFSTMLLGYLLKLTISYTLSPFFNFIGKKGLEVLVQGGVIDDLAKHLIEQYRIAKRYIEVLDKTKK